MSGSSKLRDDPIAGSAVHLCVDMQRFEMLALRRSGDMEDVTTPKDDGTSLTGTCNCGALAVVCTGAPIRVSVCHCRDCKRRTGSAFSWNARFSATRVRIEGEAATWRRTGPSGAATTRRFCPVCGVTVAYASDAEPDVVAIPCGAFADPGILKPHRTVWAERCNPWVEITAEPMEFGH